MMKSLASLALTLLAAPLLAQTAQPVLMISVDGMKPEYVTHADEHHLKLPNLRRILHDGVYADGVTGVFPTVTYPNHTTLVTGVWPAEHGIYNNQRFDPEHKLNSAWYWYAPQIKVATLWSAAHAAHETTASIGWPVTVDSPDIDYLIPEYWHGSGPGDNANPDDRLLMESVSRPLGEVARIAERTGTPYMNGNDTEISGDQVKTTYALDILKQHKPMLMTIHLSSLDEAEHLHAPFSEDANADLEQIDTLVGKLVDQELANYPNAVIAIVSDHGFARIDHSVNFYVPFIEAGLIEPGKPGAAGAISVKSWKAEPWLGGGMAAIMLHDPNDTATRDQVKTLLTKLAADPANGIVRVLDHDALGKLGGFPDASFLVTLKVGYVTGPALTGPFVTELAGQLGTHGFDPIAVPEMHSSFFVMGKGIAAGKDLGQIDMRQIAPTIAHLLHVSLPTATQPVLSLK